MRALPLSETLGATITALPVESDGRIDCDDLRRAISRRTILVSVMRANNQVGAIQPSAEATAAARERGVHRAGLANLDSEMSGFSACWTGAVAELVGIEVRVVSGGEEPRIA